MAAPAQCLVHADAAADTVALQLSGNWQLSATAPCPDLIAALAGQSPATVRVDGRALTGWDSLLAARLVALHRHCHARAGRLQLEGLPDGLQRLLALATAIPPHRPPTPPPLGFRASLRHLADRPRRAAQAFLAFLGEVLLALGLWLRGRSPLRRGDLAYWFEQAGPRALPIVTLISLLVGLILAYLGAVQLRQFGAQVYVANLVSIGMTREMGALMTAIIVAGRTGAAYAAQLGAMQANDEIDALKTMGISPVGFLVLPRLLAVLLALPLLTLYAYVVGMTGGGLIALGMGISPLQYAVQTQESIGMAPVFIGLGKSLVFAFLIALAGCRHGLASGRDSTAVGQATTRAVVSAIVSIIVADSVINVLLDRLGI